jgi:lambda family phage portal protein
LIKQSWLDKAALAISPSWGTKRLRHKLAVHNLKAAGYITPDSPNRSMQGTDATANNPDRDMAPKLKGSRGLSRDMAMNSPLAISILRRHKLSVINSGLQVQPRIDRKFLGLTDEQADTWEDTARREFDMLANDIGFDFDNQNTFGDQQMLAFFNMMMSGDCFMMLPWRARKNSPYELSVKLIDGDLVRDPKDFDSTKDIVNGVEKDSTGRVVAYHVWNTYADDWAHQFTATSTRVPVFDENGRQQIFHIVDPERIGQRRGMPLLAPVLGQLKQLTRLSEAELMHALVSSFFTIFVKDFSGLQSTLDAGIPKIKDDPATAAAQAAGDDDVLPPLQMGHGNITYIDDQKDVTIADPEKTDKGFEDFYNALAKQICAAGGCPLETTLMFYQTSYTAAKAAVNDAYNFTINAQTLMRRRMTQPVYNEVILEGTLKGRMTTPGFFDDKAIEYAWTKAFWQGQPQRQINPLTETKAAILAINSKISTREDQFLPGQDARWQDAMVRYSRENKLLEDLEIVDTQTENELVGEDGQKNKKESENETL